MPPDSPSGVMPVTPAVSQTTAGPLQISLFANKSTWGLWAYGEPPLTFQQMYRLIICRSLLNRHLTSTSVGYVPRVNAGRTSTNVGQYIDHDIGRSILVKYRSTNGGILVNRWSCISCWSRNSRLLARWYRLSTVSQLTSTNSSDDTIITLSIR